MFLVLYCLGMNERKMLSSDIQLQVQLFFWTFPIFPWLRPHDANSWTVVIHMQQLPLSVLKLKWLFQDFCYCYTHSKERLIRNCFSHIWHIFLSLIPRSENARLKCNSANHTANTSSLELSNERRASISSEEDILYSWFVLQLFIPEYMIVP